MTNEHLAGLFVSADHVIVASCCMPVLGTEQVRLLQPVCTTEIGRLALKYKDLEKKGVKLATLSADPVSCNFALSYPFSFVSLHRVI